MGDPSGIGPEIIIKALPHICTKTVPVVVGDKKIMDHMHKILTGKELDVKPFREGSAGEAEIFDLKMTGRTDFGVSLPEFGAASFAYITEGLKLVLAGEVAAIVTCPINKKSIHSAGIPFTGHTEMMAHYGGVSEYVMMMANRKIRVSLVTIHIPLRDVPASITTESVLKTITITHRSLQKYFGIRQPVIKVCGLNPHAGEEGIMGDEERYIHGAIEEAGRLGMDARGPFPADTLFHKKDCDAYIAMYHDQGLVAVKTLDFSGTVNITLGLPFIRTSPGHGTGFDIAGLGVADPSSLIEAYRTAEAMSLKTS